jgi:hypothetical protein
VCRFKSVTRIRTHNNRTEKEGQWQDEIKPRAYREEDEPASFAIIEVAGRAGTSSVRHNWKKASHRHEREHPEKCPSQSKKQWSTLNQPRQEEQWQKT